MRSRRFRPLPARTLRARGASTGLLVAALTLVPLGLPQAAAAPDVASILAKADRRLEKGDFRPAARLYAKADRAAGGHSVPALAGRARASVRAGDYGETVVAARRWGEIGGPPESRAEALFFEGLGHYWQGMTARWSTPGDPAQSLSGWDGGASARGAAALEAAVRAFRHGLEASADSQARAPTLLYLADTLVELGELDAAREALAAYAETGGGDAYAENLRCWVDQLQAAPTVEASVAGVTPPEAIYVFPPDYTPDARAAEAFGAMFLELAVTAQGDVACLRAIRGLPFGMVQSVADTARQWRFRPALRDGQPIPVRHTMSFSFEQR